MELRAARVPSDGAGSGWYNILPPPPPPRVLEDDVSADWVIIGAGFAGLSAAHRIKKSQPDDKVVVLDAQPAAWGAAGRNSGFVIDLPHNIQSGDYSGGVGRDGKEILLNRFAIDYVKTLADECGLAEYLSPIGKINAAADRTGMDALEHYCGHLEKLKEPFTRYDKAELKEILGTDYYNGGIHTPGCLLIQPAAYIRGVADGLSPDVEIYENSPALGLAIGDAKKVNTAKGSVTAGRIILTVNGHLQSFGFYHNRLMHVYLYASMTRELSEQEQKALGGSAEWGVTPAHPMGTTVRRIRENRIVMRNHITYNPDLTHSRNQLRKAGARQINAFRRRFPMLPEVDMEYCWSGSLCLSRNSVSVFGEIEKDLYAACCHNGLGASKGTLNGVLIADFAMGRHDPMIDHLLAADQPAGLFPEPFMSIGAKTYLWWGQRRAGNDV